MATNPSDDAFSSETAKGLTKREYFAAMALQGILANPLFFKETKDLKLRNENCDDIGHAATMAVFHADALIKDLDENESIESE